MTRLEGVVAAAWASLLASSGVAQEPSPISPPASRQEYNSVVVFGDSLVDAGNARILTEGRRAPPEQGYIAGRISNGYTFADRIAMGVEGQVTTASRSGGNNHAVAGARALADDDASPDAAAQIEEWRSRRRGAADPGTLFIFTFGSNDLRPPANAEPAREYAEAVAQAYARAVRMLFDNGARTVLVTGVAVPTPAAAALQQRIDAELDRIALADGQRLLRYDFQPFWRHLIANAASFGFRPFDPQAPTCVEDRAWGTGCPGYLLFDRPHPVAAVHALIARDMAERLGVPVAEPTAPSASSTSTR